MAQPKLPPDIEAALASLRADLDRLWGQVTEEQQTLMARWYYLKPHSRVARLADMERTIRELSVLIEVRVRDSLGVMHDAYETGAWNAALAAGTQATFNLPDIDAMAKVALDTYDDILAATQHMRSDAKALVRTMTKDWVNAKLATGKTAEDAGIDLALALKDESISGIVYKNGARVSVSTYADMVMRTKTALAYQEGGFQQGHTLGIEWWEIMDGPDCVMPGSRFTSDGDLLQIVRAPFDGVGYRVTTAGGPTITVGPQHPVMTQRGWVRGHDLRVGDQLFHGQRLEDAAAVPEADLHECPTVEDVFEAARLTFGSVTRPTRSHDLHGDGRFCEGEIEVVTTARGLLVKGHAQRLQRLRQFHLMRPYVQLPGMPGPCTSLHGLLGPCRPPHGVVGGRHSRGAFLGSGAGRLQAQRLRDATAQAHAADELGNGSRRSANGLSDVGGGLAVLVAANYLVTRKSRSTHDRLLTVEAVEEVQYRGWVYDATTTAGTFRVDDILVKNCGLTYHEDPTLADGLIVDTTTAERWPISHVNCVRVTSPRPDIHNANEAKAATPTPTEEQRADQAAASRAREAANARRPRKISLESQAAARARRRTEDIALRSQGMSPAEERFARRTK